jgi:TrmH family RNA methyltransferase
MKNTITSANNQRVVEARKLIQRKYRQRQGRFLVEGLQIIHLALDAGFVPLEVFYCESQFAGKEALALLERTHRMNTSLLPVSEHVLATLSQRSGTQGIVATFATFETALSALQLTGNELIIVLDRLQYPGNIGTVIRAADAVGAAAVVLLEPCADLFDPKAVRGSMGSLFNIPCPVVRDVAQLAEWLHCRGLPLVGADVRAHIDHWVRLPMYGRVDSLNVGVAGGVFMYTWVRANLG